MELVATMRNPKRPQLSPLFELEHSLRKTRPQPPKPHPAPPTQKLPSNPLPNQKVTAQAFDWDETIELEYRREAFPDTSLSPSPFSEQYSFSAEPEDTSQSFEVEAFELDEDEEQSAEVDAQAKAFELEDEDEVDSVDRSIPAQPEGKTYRHANRKKNPETKPVEVDLATPFSARPLKSAHPLEQSGSAKDAETDNDSTDTFDAEAFAADIEAILTGKAEVPAQPTETPSIPSSPEPAQPHPHDVFDQIAQGKLPPPTPTPSPELPAQEEGEARPFAYSHAIFDQMAEGMAYANSFNLGTISLEQKFDEFDRLLDQEEQQKQAAPEPVLSHAAELDDQELAEDLALINGVEFADQMGQLPTKGKKPTPEVPKIQIPKIFNEIEPRRLFAIIWSIPAAKKLLWQYAKSQNAGDLDLLAAIEAEDPKTAKRIITDHYRADKHQLRCIKLDLLVEDDLINVTESDEPSLYDFQIMQGSIKIGFIRWYFRPEAFYSSAEGEAVAKILTQSQQMAVPAIDTTVGDVEVDQTFSREEEEESSEQSEIAMAMTRLFVVSSNNQQAIIDALKQNKLTVDLINPELELAQKPQLTDPIKITQSAKPYNNCWNITDKNQLSYNLRISTDDNDQKTLEVHDTTPEVEYAISALKSLEIEFRSLRKQVAGDTKFPTKMFTEVRIMTSNLEEILKRQGVPLQELIDLAVKATKLKGQVAEYRPKLTEQQRQENFLTDFNNQLEIAIDQEIWQRGKNYGGTVPIIVPQEYWQPIRDRYHNQPIAKQEQEWGKKSEETVKYYVTEKSRSIDGFDISGHIWNSEGDTLETVFVLHIFWER